MCLIATFAIVTDAYSNATYILFDRSRPSMPSFFLKPPVPNIMYDRHRLRPGHVSLDPCRVRYIGSHHHRYGCQPWSQMGGGQ